MPFGPEDIKKFRADPKNQKESEFLDAFFEDFLTRKAEAAKSKAPADETIFDRIARSLSGG
jgi:hypothetical protein